MKNTLIDEWPNVASSIVKLARLSGKLTPSEEDLVANGKEGVVAFMCLVRLLRVVYRKRVMSDKTFGSNIRTVQQSFILCAKVELL